MANQIDRHDIDDTLYVFKQDNSKRWYARFQLFGKWYCKATKQKDLEEAKATARYLRTEYKIKIETGTYRRASGSVMLHRKLLSKWSTNLQWALARLHTRITVAH
jgi:hypothetical protein